MPPASAAGAPRLAVPDQRDGRGDIATAAHRVVSWDVLRVGFVAMVILYHATFIGPLVYPDLIPRSYVFPHQVGASLLLVVSALFACRTLPRAASISSWWWLRVSRLMPPFLVATIMAWAALRWLAPSGWYYPDARDLVANLLMLWHWDRSWGYVDGSYWTIPLQLLAFTIAAALALGRLGRGPGLRVVLWAALLVPLAQWPLRLRAAPDTAYAVVVDGLGFHRAHLFVAGVAIFLWSARRLRTGHFVGLMLVVVLAQWVQTSMLAAGTVTVDTHAVVAVSLGMGVIAFTARHPGWARVLPARLQRLVQWLAGISYGMFLVHQTLGYVLMRRLQDLGLGPTVQTAAMFVNAVGFGWLVTRVVERPARRLLTGRLGRVPADQHGKAGPTTSL